jgi:Superinfection immunity protein
MQALADSSAFWILIFTVLIVVYLLPTLIGLARGVDAQALVFLVNLIGAPTGIGWAAALILAFGPRRLPPEPPWPLHQGTLYDPAEIWMPGPCSRHVHLHTKS